MWKNYLKAFDDYFTFSGRASRAEFWNFAFISFLIALFLLILGGCYLYLLGSSQDSSEVLYFLYPYALLSAIPNMALLSRRLHDTDKSFWFYLIGFVPAIGGVILIVLLAQTGDQRTNAYGDPVSDEEVTSAFARSFASNTEVLDTDILRDQDMESNLRAKLFRYGVWASLTLVIVTIFNQILRLSLIYLGGFEFQQVLGYLPINYSWALTPLPILFFLPRDEYRGARTTIIICTIVIYMLSTGWRFLA